MAVAYQSRIDEERTELEEDWLQWCLALFEGWFCDSRGNLIKPGPHHHEFWEWLWQIELGENSHPFVAIWPRGGGKALTVDTPIPTPTGWTHMGNIAVGDAVYDHRGVPTEVTAVTEVAILPCAELTFGGASLVASLDHDWRVMG